MRQRDAVIIGGGIVGLATAYRLLQARPGLELTVIEKESELARHQTGHNSGVIHSGIYYRPGSLRAVHCREGKQQLEEFCTETGIPFERCGKVIVATHTSEIPALEEIYRRGQANGVTCRRIDAGELHELEPHCAGLQAIHVPESGIVDYRAVALKLAERIRDLGGEIACGTQLLSVTPDGKCRLLNTSQGEYRARVIASCAGLQADRVSALCGIPPETRIIPFRGEYYELSPSASHLCRHLIYPVPDPRFPFLGVHFTRMIQGGVECGPNAVLAFAREGYHKSDINPRDLWDALSYPGFRKLGLKYWAMGWEEMWRSYSKRAFVRALRRLIPEIRAEDLHPAPAGVRAQAVTPDGQLVDDFLFASAENMVHVLNAPSPAATASLRIGQTISECLLPLLNES